MHKLTTILSTLAAAVVFSSSVSAATLQMDDGFFATASNGKPVSTHQHNLFLTEGKQVITVHHEQLVNYSNERTEYQVQGPMHLIFDAQSGTTYNLKKTADGVSVLSNNRPVPVTIYNDSQAINKSLM